MFLYAQCLLENDDGLQEIAWIPNEFAHQRKRIRLTPKDEQSFESTVIEVYHRTSEDATKFKNYWIDPSKKKESKNGKI